MEVLGRRLSASSAPSARATADIICSRSASFSNPPCHLSRGSRPSSRVPPSRLSLSASRLGGTHSTRTVRPTGTCRAPATVAAGVCRPRQKEFLKYKPLSKPLSKRNTRGSANRRHCHSHIGTHSSPPSQRARRCLSSCCSASKRSSDASARRRRRLRLARPLRTSLLRRATRFSCCALGSWCSSCRRAAPPLVELAGRCSPPEPSHPVRFPTLYVLRSGAPHCSRRQTPALCNHSPPPTPAACDSTAPPPQCGFGMLESGSVTSRSTQAILLKCAHARPLLPLPPSPPLSPARDPRRSATPPPTARAPPRRAPTPPPPLFPPSPPPGTSSTLASPACSCRRAGGAGVKGACSRAGA